MYSFGVFELDAADLRRGGRRVHLQEQPFRVLHSLLARPGELITREELQSRLWPDDVYVDRDRGLNKAVYKLRQALGDADADGPRFIETIPRRGYRFIAAVERTPVSSPLATSTPPAGRRLRPGPLVLAGAALAVALAFAWQWHRVADQPGGLAASRVAATPSAPALDAYRRGRALFEERTPAALRQALEQFRLATRLDPDFALAHAGEVHALGPLVTLGFEPTQAVLPAMRTSAARAVELGPDLAEAHTAVALVRSLDWDWAGEERAYRRAIALDPSYVTAYTWYAFLLECLGRPLEAMALRRQAVDLDPVNLTARASLANAFFLVGDSATALRHYDATLTLEPSFALAHGGRGLVLLTLGRQSEALEALERSHDRGAFGYALAVTGQSGRARSILADLVQQRSTSYVSPLAPAAVHAGLGELDEAFAWLERAYVEHTPWLMRLNVDLRFSPLRSDPRFARLAGRIGLPSPRPATEAPGAPRRGPATGV